MTRYTTVAECDQELKRTVHTIELARIDLFLKKQKAIDEEIHLYEILHDMDSLIAADAPGKDELLQRRPNLLRIIARCKQIDADQISLLQGRLDASQSRKEDLEKLKKSIIEIAEIKARLEEIDRQLWPVKLFLRILESACVLMIGIWLILYAERTNKPPQTRKVRCLELLCGFLLAIALRTALYFSGHLRSAHEVERHLQNLRAQWRACVGGFLIVIAVRTALDFSGHLSHPLKSFEEINQHPWFSKVGWQGQLGALCVGVALRTAFYFYLP